MHVSNSASYYKQTSACRRENLAKENMQRKEIMCVEQSTNSKQFKENNSVAYTESLPGLIEIDHSIRVKHTMI